MGQAKLRGTKEQRVADALEGQRLAQEAADRAEMEELQERSRKWAAMTPEQQDAAMKRAMHDAEAYGYLAGAFGHDAANILMSMGRK